MQVNLKNDCKVKILHCNGAFAEKGITVFNFIDFL